MLFIYLIHSTNVILYTTLNVCPDFICVPISGVKLVEFYTRAMLILKKFQVWQHFGLERGNLYQFV